MWEKSNMSSTPIIMVITLSLKVAIFPPASLRIHDYTNPWWAMKYPTLKGVFTAISFALSSHPLKP